MRTALTALATAAALTLTALPALADDVPEIPPINETALRAAIAGLPDIDTTGALVRITGEKGQWSGTSGVSDLRSDAPVRPDGYFRIGSTTKVYTAVMVLQLAQEHRIDLDEPVQRYLPGLLPADYPRIPVYTLLDHTSGLPSVDIPELYDPQWILRHRYDHWSPRQVVETALRHPIDFQPGTAQKYTNTAYVTAGMLVEKVTGRSYARNLRERITEPLGLCHTYYPNDDPRLPNPAARGYLNVDGVDLTGIHTDIVTRDGSKFADVTEMNQSIPGAAGAIISTAADLDAFITGLFDGRLLGAEMMPRLFTVPQVPMFDGKGMATYSQGLMSLKLTKDLTVWGKTGSRYGYSSGVFATRDLRRKVAYSVNATVKSPDGQPRIVQQIAAAAVTPPPAHP
ncbi:D-alanyl-D-alanine carboxypeptidase [Amycolatopsis xylanica]|uniref:D-alanyl-D-alanine carboxypeptidase n=1 Tax=Amycolatopsis xylanica TaxID=589385 RepID=A0A1H3PER7_9PSEU|nr:serine hydrolase domain-containing protein [Amycolatopsis xylanica]SDY99662.1 D-alanyl-D-alanine carboxypeptidase [Amycolatopsis xylanica]